MNDLLISKEDAKLVNVKASVESLLFEITKQNRELFTYKEIENILLDIYNLTQ